MSLTLTQDQIDWIASEIQDQDELYDKPIEHALEVLGLDRNLAKDANLIEKLGETMFVCDQCDQWKNKEVRVYNKLLNEKCCEECDENNQE